MPIGGKKKKGGGKDPHKNSTSGVTRKVKKKPTKKKRKSGKDPHARK